MWDVTGWGECHVTAEFDGTCGSGAQARDVTCVLEGDVTQTAVARDLCLEGKHTNDRFV